MELLNALEHSGYAMWVKESSTAYVVVLAFHTIGLSFLVGISGATALRVLGAARSMPLAPMEDFFPLMFVGLWINVFTGAVLLTLYPTQYVVDPIIYIKLTAIVAAMVLLRKLKSHLFGTGSNPEQAADTPRAKRLAASMLLAWLVATICGRVTAYDLATRLQTVAAFIIVLGAALLIGYFVGRSLGWIRPADRYG